MPSIATLALGILEKTTLNLARRVSRLELQTSRSHNPSLSSHACLHLGVGSAGSARSGRRVVYSII